MKQLLITIVAVALEWCPNGMRMADILVYPSNEKLITDPIVEESARESF